MSNVDLYQINIELYKYKYDLYYQNLVYVYNCICIYNNIIYTLSYTIHISSLLCISINSISWFN